MTAPTLPETASRCISCGHDHDFCDCTCACAATRRLAAGVTVANFAALFCDRPPHDPHSDPLHFDAEDALWWLEEADRASEGPLLEAAQ